MIASDGQCPFELIKKINIMTPLSGKCVHLSCGWVWFRTLVGSYQSPSYKNGTNCLLIGMQALW